MLNFDCDFMTLKKNKKIKTNSKKKQVKKSKKILSSYIVIIALFLIVVLFFVTSNSTKKSGSAIAIVNTDEHMVISLKEGWNEFSTNIIPHCISLHNCIFEGVMPYLEEVQILNSGSENTEFTTIYSSETQNWTQSNFDYKTGYKVKVSEDINLSIWGQRATAANDYNGNVQILLHPGNNFISYLPNQEKNINEVFGDYADQIVNIKDKSSFSTSYGGTFYGSLNILKPGNAYFIEVNSQEPFYITYEVEPLLDFDALEYLYLDLGQEEQFTNQNFYININTNSDISELVNITLDINSNNNFNSCSLVDSNLINNNHYELINQDLSTQLSLRFNCLDVDNYNFNFTATGNQSGNLVTESIVVPVIESEPIVHYLEYVEIVNNNVNIDLNTNFDLSVYGNSNITESVDIDIAVDTADCMLNGSNIYSANMFVSSQDISSGVDLQFSCYMPRNHEFHFGIVGKESYNVLEEYLTVIVEEPEIPGIIEELESLDINYIVDNTLLEVSTYFNDNITEEVNLVFDTNVSACALEDTNYWTDNFEFNNTNSNEFTANFVCEPVNFDLEVIAIGQDSGLEIIVNQTIIFEEEESIDYIEVNNCEDLSFLMSPNNTLNPDQVISLNQDLNCLNLDHLYLYNSVEGNNHELSIYSLTIFQSDIYLKDLVLNDLAGPHIMAIDYSNVDFNNITINYPNLNLELSWPYTSETSIVISPYSHVNFNNLEINIDAYINGMGMSIFGTDSESILNINNLAVNSNIDVMDLYFGRSIVLFGQIAYSQVNVHNGYMKVEGDVDLSNSGVYLVGGMSGADNSSLNIDNFYSFGTYCSNLGNDLEQININNSFGIDYLEDNEYCDINSVYIEDLWNINIFEQQGWNIVNSSEPQNGYEWYMEDSQTLPELNWNSN